MNAADLIATLRQGGIEAHVHVNAFVDEFRRATLERRVALVERGADRSGPMEGLVAAIVSQLCRETGTPFT